MKGDLRPLWEPFAPWRMDRSEHPRWRGYCNHRCSGSEAFWSQKERNRSVVYHEISSASDVTPDLDGNFSDNISSPSDSPGDSLRAINGFHTRTSDRSTSRHRVRAASNSRYDRDHEHGDDSSHRSKSYKSSQVQPHTEGGLPRRRTQYATRLDTSTHMETEDDYKYGKHPNYWDESSELHSRPRALSDARPVHAMRTNKHGRKRDARL